MSFLNPRNIAARPNHRLITDLPDPLLKVILQNCSSVDMTRCSLVNRQFRELIEDMEDERTESLRSCQKAKIFICDRRRAILEGVSTPVVPTRLPRTPKNSESSDSGSSSSSSIASTSSASSESGSESSSTKTKTKAQQTQERNQQEEQRKRNVSDRTKTTSTSTDSSGTNSKTTNFISDQYTDVADPNWAFAFDFDSWLQDYEVNEVYFKNFCSFLEREKLEDQLPSTYKGRTAFYESQQLLDRATAMTIADAQVIRLNKGDEQEMKTLSAGRIERLAKKLDSIRSAHYIFKDSVCYGARPPVTIFYFLQMMSHNTRALTLDHVQSATKVELHEVLDMANLSRLTIIQPEERQCVQVRSTLLTNWINLEAHERKRISIHLVGCKEFKSRDILLFVQEWVNQPKPAVFKKIAIDGGSYKYNEFVTILEKLHDVIEKRPPRSPLNRSFVQEQNQHAIVFEKMCRIPHPKDRRYVIQMKYCKSSRRMVLTVEKDDTPAPIKPLSPVSTLTRLARPQSAAAMITTPIRKISSSLKPVSPIPPANQRQLIRPLSHDPMHLGCRENVGSGSTMFTRLVSFLGTSS